MRFIALRIEGRSVTDPGVRIADHVRSSYPDVLDAIDAAGARASEDWPADGIGDASSVRAAFRRELDAAGVHDRLPRILVSAVEAAGGTLRSSPVAAPPYVVVTSLGITLRATLEAHRLVVELRVFEQQDGRYHRRDTVAVAARLV